MSDVQGKKMSEPLVKWTQGVESPMSPQKHVSIPGLPSYLSVWHQRHVWDDRIGLMAGVSDFLKGLTQRHAAALSVANETGVIARHGRCMKNWISSFAGQYERRGFCGGMLKRVFRRLVKKLLYYVCSHYGLVTL